ncbi:hypothetical protein [Solimonas marina]|uniref:DUF4124 domain-containing protein n=1 Tax=Solimonas marina TaxID=2714601 RepID=A0A969WE52_9GAMM|nr:hypothetical protein [Solimonas marina]NKF24559.1 hypothetical protein [Solimonas marina]
MVMRFPVYAAAGAALSLLAMAAQAAPSSSGKRFTCWTDNQGHRACGDAVPPQYAQKQREVYDDQGRVREVKPREKTADEVAAEEKAAHDAAAKAVREQKQRDYDHFLLSTYDSAADIERARDERVAMIEGRRALTEKTVADNQKAIEQQQSRIDVVKRGGHTPGKALTDKLADLQASLVDNQKALQNFVSEKQQVTDKYNADLARYRELHGSAAGAE